MSQILHYLLTKSKRNRQGLIFSFSESLIHLLQQFENFQNSLKTLRKIIFQMELATSSLKLGLYTNGKFIYCLSNNLRELPTLKSHF